MHAVPLVGITSFILASAMTIRDLINYSIRCLTVKLDRFCSLKNEKFIQEFFESCIQKTGNRILHAAWTLVI